MFSLLYGFYDYIFHKPNYFVLILGLDNSGKTTFLEQSKFYFQKTNKRTDFGRIAATVGLNVAKFEIRGVTLNFWDLGGQEELRPLWNKYYSEAHAIIWVVDSSDKDRLNESVESFKDVIKNRALENLPLLFVINKQDLPIAMNPNDVISSLSQDVRLIGDRPFLPLPISALTGNGIYESICWIAEQVKISLKPPSE